MPRSNKNSTSNEKERDKANRIIKLSKLLKLDDLNELEKSSILELIYEFPHQFLLPGDKLGSTTLASHKIITTDDLPLNTKQYRYPQIHKDEIQKQVKDLLDQDIIQPSESPYNSPVWIVPKKSDSSDKPRWRMVIDYRALNDKTITNIYPLPNITEILDLLGGSKYFITLDLASGFHQISMDPDSKSKTAFSTPQGHYEYNRMPFGLKNAPSTFQRFMDKILSGLQGIEMFVYMDDIVVYASSISEHIRKLKTLLSRLKIAGLALQPEKCMFLRRGITYLGHYISEEGVKPHPQKIEAVKKFPVPKTKKQILEFTGLVGYYRRFINNFANIAKPMTVLLKGNNDFMWNEGAQEAFEILRDTICSQPILQFPNFTQPFVITTDASNYAIGAVLSQGPIGKDLPISYASRTLDDREINYSTTDKEMLAIIFAVKHFRPYVYGRKFTLVTDHRPLIWLHNTKRQETQVARWKLQLNEYDYDMVYKPGRVNSNADALSRNPVDGKRSSVIHNDMCKGKLRSKSIKTGIDGVCTGSENEQTTLNVTATNESLVQSVFVVWPTARTGLVDLTSDAGSDSNCQVIDECGLVNPALKDTLNKSTELLNEKSSPLLLEKMNPCFGDVAYDTLPSVGGEEMLLFSNDPFKDGRVCLTKDTRCMNTRTQTRSLSNTKRKLDSNDPNEPKSKQQYSLPVKYPVWVLNTCLFFSKDLLNMRFDHIVNFLPVDCKPTARTSVDLASRKRYSLEKLLNQNPVLGQTVATNDTKYYTFHLFVSNTAEEKPSLSNVERCIFQLRLLTEALNVKSFSISKIDNGLEEIPWESIETVFKDTFCSDDYSLTICTGTIKRPDKSKRQNIIKEAHESLVGGHLGVTKTYNRIRADYHWEKLKTEIEEFIRSCPSCQVVKRGDVTKEPMKITDTPTRAFEKIQLDIVGPLPETIKKNKYLLTIQDNLTKFSDAIPLASTDTVTVAMAFAENFITRFGCPRTIHTDQGSNFISKLMKSILKIFKIQHINSTAYHPESLGSLERAHRVFVEYLKQYCSDDNWDDYIRFCMFSYNTSVHEATKFTPHELVFGMKANIPTEFSTDNVPRTFNMYFDDLVGRLNFTQKSAAENLNRAKQRCKRYYDKNAHIRDFRVGDVVYFLNEVKKNKFSPKWLGPRKIIEVSDNINAILQMTERTTKKFHFNKLKYAWTRPEPLPDNPDDT